MKDPIEPRPEGLVAICSYHLHPTKEALELMAAQQYPGLSMTHSICEACTERVCLEENAVHQIEHWIQDARNEIKAVSQAA